MDWICGRPAQPGYYWIKDGPYDGDEPIIVQLVYDDQRILKLGGGFLDDDVPGRIYYGPLESPKGGV